MDIKRIDPEEARELLDSGESYTYLDVRSEEEFAQGHVPGSVNIPPARWKNNLKKTAGSSPPACAADDP